MSSEAVARVIVVDGAALVVDGISSLLASFDDIEVVARCRSLAELDDVLTSVDVDVILVGHDMPDGDVAAAIARVDRCAVPARVIVLAGSADGRSVSRAFEAGAAGYLLRSQQPEDVAAAIRLVRSGGVVLAPGARDALLSGARDPHGTHPLSARERDVLRAVAVSGSAPKAALALELSPKTVRNHLHRVMSKLGVHSTVEAVVIALREDLIDLPDGRGHWAS